MGRALGHQSPPAGRRVRLHLSVCCTLPQRGPNTDAARPAAAQPPLRRDRQLARPPAVGPPATLRPAARRRPQRLATVVRLARLTRAAACVLRRLHQLPVSRRLAARGSCGRRASGRRRLPPGPAGATLSSALTSSAQLKSNWGISLTPATQPGADGQGGPRVRVLDPVGACGVHWCSGAAAPASCTRLP